MNAHAARRHFLEVAGRLNDLLGRLLVKVALGAHAADDAAAAHGDVAVLMGQQDGGADALISAARRVGAVNAGQDGNAHLLEFGMAEEAGAASAPVGIDLLLLRQLHAGTVDQPDQGDIQLLAISVTRRLFSACPAIQAPAMTLLSKPISTHHLPLIRARPSMTPVIPSSLSRGL